MKILIVYNIHRHGGGADIVAKQTAELLNQSGHIANTFIKSSKELFNFIGYIKAFFSGIFPGTKLLKEFEQKLDTFKPDIVFAHELYPLITPWILKICKKKQIRTAITCHDFRITCPIATHFNGHEFCNKCIGKHEYNCIIHNCAGSISKSISYALRNIIARKFKLFEDYIDLYFTPSTFSKNFLVANTTISENKIITVGNPLSDTSGLNTPFISGDYFLYVGRFGIEKGVNILLQAIRNTNIPLKLIGDFSALINKKGYKKNIEFLGFLPQSKLFEFYKNARAVIIPSICHETFGLVVAEALSCATPVIISNIGALPEIAGPGGIIIQPGNISELRSAIIKLWDDIPLCKQKALDGQKHIRKYANDRYINNIVTEFEHLIKLKNI